METGARDANATHRARVDLARAEEGGLRLPRVVWIRRWWEPC